MTSCRFWRTNICRLMKAASARRSEICRRNVFFISVAPQSSPVSFLPTTISAKAEGYDHAFLLQAKGDGKKSGAHVRSADEKLQLKVYTTAPALQFYSGNFLGGTPSRN
ncbi:hypothetical protein ACNKHX_03405 [Shigella flexneri]